MKVMSHNKINLSCDKKLFPFLVFQLVVRHRLNACDISPSACDKVRLIQMSCQNLVPYHILNIAQPDNFQCFHSEGIYIEMFLYKKGKFRNTK